MKEKSEKKEKKEKKEKNENDEVTLIANSELSNSEELKEELPTRKRKSKEEKKEKKELKKLKVDAKESKVKSKEKEIIELKEKEIKPADDPDAGGKVVIVQDQHIDSYRPSSIQKVDDTAIPDNLKLESLGLVESTLLKLKERNVKSLFPIQAACYRPVMDGKDLLARARTGTGKTLAFSLPIVDCLKKLKMENPSSFQKRGRGPKVLIMAPTRELALQVSKEFTQLCGSELSTACFYGGTFYDEQMKTLSDGVDVVVGKILFISIDLIL